MLKPLLRALLFGALLVNTIVAAHAAEPVQAADDGWREGTWQAPGGQEQIPLWPQAAPDMAGFPPGAERVRHKGPPYIAADRAYTQIIDVSTPTLTVFPPQGSNTGAAVVVFPGGGFWVLAIDLEGTEICDWITAQGMTCVLLKYRVPRSNHYYDRDCRCHVTPAVPWALQDAQRAIRLVRSKASELRIQADKIGVIGFSAGGYLVAQTSTILAPAYEPVDAVDRISSRPDFAVALYPGHLCRDGDVLDPSIQVTAQAPPTFLLQAWDDAVDNICHSLVYARALAAAGVSAEVHLFAKGGHAFGLRRNPHPVGSWPALVEHWLRDIAILPASAD